MKRKRVYGGFDEPSHSIYTAPPLESTMLIETGNQATGSDCIGKVDTVAVNASLSSGTRLFQYNRFFWDKDLFTFNLSNCCCFVALAYYINDGASNIGAYTLFYPIFLPRSSLCTLQSLEKGNLVENPAKRKYLIDDLLYYLNGAFTSFNYDTLPAPPQVVWMAFPPNYKFQGGPSLYAQSYKGFLQRPTANNPLFPFFQDNYPPPVKFIYAGSNNQIALVRNPDFWSSPPSGLPANADIAFQIVSPDSLFFFGDSNPTNIVLSSVAPNVVPNTSLSFSALSVANGGGGYSSSGSVGNTGVQVAERGWCGQGCYATGFAQTRSALYPNQFSDAYGDDPRRRVDLFHTTLFPPYQPPFSLPNGDSDWLTYVQTYRLDRTIVLARKICSLIPSRFFTIESEILTRDQKMMPLSNNPILSTTSIMGVEYLDLNFIRTRADETLSGRVNSKLEGDTCINHMNPFYSVQSIDLYLRDEFGNYIQNFRTPTGYTVQFSGDDYVNMTSDITSYSGDFCFSAIEGEASFNNGVYTIPAWLAAMNPNTLGGNTQPLIAPFSTYLSQPAYGLFTTNGSNKVASPGVKLPANFCPNMPYSGNLIHFGRVLGQ